MNDSDLDEERRLFERCVDSDPQQWNQLLEDHCDNPQVRQRIRRMLDLHHDTGAEDSGFLRLDGSEPDRIGPYRILQRLGEGGMGIVYAAEQREPVRRRVAVKVLRGGYSSREVLARFDVERQALALMNHVNIARILDAGTTADHRPYIVMEFVPGVAITRYCEHRNLPLRKRLLLFREICEAVQHAHQKGVIHRDIKPSNILVMEEDGSTIPKIIDFGIAKAITQRLTDQTLETKVGSLLGTPDYMSPEQSELSPLDIDTRTDIYALGAVLYELLSGVPPFQLASSGKSYLEMQRVIAEQTPLPPSQRVAGAARRQIRRDLDWITLKALEKQRAQRYASASEFAADIVNHLEGAPLLAGPPSRVRRIMKLAHRHWLTTASVAIVMLTLAVSQLVLMQKNRELAAERDRANRETQIAEKVTEFTAGLFAHTSPAVSGSRESSARELLDAGVRQLERTTGQPPDVQAALLEAAAGAYSDLGVYDEATRLFEETLRLREEMRDVHPVAYVHSLLKFANSTHFSGARERSAQLAQAAGALLEKLPAAHPQQVLIHARLANLWHTQGRHAEARELLAPVLQQPGRDGDPAYALATSILGRIYREEGDFEAAERYLQQAIAIERERGESLSQLARETKSELAGMYVDLDQSERAEPLLRELVTETRQVYGEEHPEVATLLNNHARALALDPERQVEAEQVFREAIRMGVATRGEGHPGNMTARNNLAVLYATQNKWQQSRDAFAENVRSLQATRGDDHWQTANARLGLARSLVHLGQQGEAEKLLRKALPPFLERFGEGHWRTAIVHHVLGLALIGQEREEEALVELHSAYSVLRETLGVEHARTIAVAEDLARLQNQLPPL